MANLYLPRLISSIVDDGVIVGHIAYILKVGIWMLGVTVLGGIASVGASWFGSQAAAGFGKRLRSELFRHVEGFNLHEFDELGTSSMIVRTTNDVMQEQQMMNMLLRMMVMAPLTAIGGLILAITTDAKLTIVLAVSVPILGLCVYLVMGRGLGLFRQLQQKVDGINRVLRENLSGVRVIRAFNRTDYEIGRFDNANRDLTDTAVQVFQLMALIMPLVILVMNVSTVVIVWFGGIQINAQTLQIGQLIAFIQYVMQIMSSVMMVSMMSFLIPRAEASAQRVNEALALHSEVLDPSPAQELPVGPLDVTFDHVSFRYPGAEEAAVSDISFTALAGKTTAIIGGTGSGKSTLCNLILRFYDVNEGSVRVGGVDVRAVRQAALRSRMGYVPQRAVLFSGSIAENIHYGKLEAPDERVQAAAVTAQAMEFVDSMEGRFAAEITQGGANLSGGQKQRLSMARALVRDADIYVFDDSFSALDFKTDAQLRAALRRDLTMATILIVAQRVSTVVDADRIVVLDEGRLVGVGTHRELLKTCPVYEEICASQLSPEEIA